MFMFLVCEDKEAPTFVYASSSYVEKNDPDLSEARKELEWANADFMTLHKKCNLMVYRVSP